MRLVTAVFYGVFDIDAVSRGDPGEITQHSFTPFCTSFPALAAGSRCGRS